MTPASSLPDRIKFESFVLERLPSGQCLAKVSLSWHDDVHFLGEAQGLTSQAGELRCAAQACVLALTKAVRGEMAFELLGVKSVRAFDSNVVIVSLALPGEVDTHRVVGCYLTDEDPARGAAIAVLNATNRLLGNRFFRS